MLDRQLGHLPGLHQKNGRVPQATENLYCRVADGNRATAPLIMRPPVRAIDYLPATPSATVAHHGSVTAVHAGMAVMPGASPSHRARIARADFLVHL